MVDIFDDTSSRRFSAKKMANDISNIEDTSFNVTKIEHGATYVTIEAPIGNKDRVETLIQKWLNEGMDFSVETYVKRVYTLTKR